MPKPAPLTSSKIPTAVTRHADSPTRDARHGFRGVPPLPTFDFAKIADGQLLTDFETAQVLRVSTATLEAWRQRQGHGLRWVAIAGGFVRYRAGDIRAFLASGRPRQRKPKPKPPPAAPEKRRARRAQADESLAPEVAS